MSDGPDDEFRVQLCQASGLQSGAPVSGLTQSASLVTLARARMALLGSQHDAARLEQIPGLAYTSR